MTRFMDEVVAIQKQEKETIKRRIMSELDLFEDFVVLGNKEHAYMQRDEIKKLVDELADSRWL